MKIIAQYIDGLTNMTVPELFEKLRQKVVAPLNHVSSTPTKDYLQGDTIEEYSHSNGTTRVTVVIFPNREELQMTYKGSSMWIVNDHIQYRLVLPVSKHFAD